MHESIEYRLQRGDTVVAVSDTGVEMLVESLDDDEPVALCVWPLFDNDDQPLYRKPFAIGDLMLVRRGATNMLATHVEASRRPPAPSDMRAMRHVQEFEPVDLRPVRSISDEALDAMEQGWTPQQVRAVIADYRALTRSKGQS